MARGRVYHSHPLPNGKPRAGACISYKPGEDPTVFNPKRSKTQDRFELAEDQHGGLLIKDKKLR